MRIDAQVGFVDRARFRYDWAPQRDFTPEDFGRILSRNSYDGAIAAPMLEDPAETDRLLETAPRCEWIAGLVGSSTKPVPADGRWRRTGPSCARCWNGAARSD